MKQRGFISSLYLYAIAGVMLLALSYGLYYQIQKNGRLSAENTTLIASVEYLNKQREKEAKAQEKAVQDKAQAEKDASKARRELTEIRRKYAKLLDELLPTELLDRLRNAIDSANQDMPATKPDRRLPTA